MECVSDHDNCLRIVSRAGWGARPSKEVEYMIIPVQYVVIQHTATPECTTASKCAARVAGLQAYFIDTLHNSDIGENCLGLEGGMSILVGDAPSAISMDAEQHYTCDVHTSRDVLVVDIVLPAGRKASRSSVVVFGQFHQNHFNPSARNMSLAHQGLFVPLFNLGTRRVYSSLEGCSSQKIQRTESTLDYNREAYYCRNNECISPSFLIGGDGKVYEGVGWHKIGAHTKGYNTMALGITLIGNFSAIFEDKQRVSCWLCRYNQGHPNGSSGVCAITDKLPPKVQLEALKKLLECGVKMGELDPDFKLLAHRQLIATESPGMTLFLELQNWPEWAEHL
uniref:Peptidoglycan recognition protein family domain-containing protein n=1 Tax=Timema bartmani TaxID=61472 RepID=A0A7R9HWI8_9NEOP|nr:unnamed protein product [Timema bartmani]